MKTKATRLTTSIAVGTPMHDWYYSMNERQRSIVVHEALLNHFLLKTGQLQQPMYPQFLRPMTSPVWPAVVPAPATPSPVILTPETQVVPATASAPVVGQPVTSVAPVIKEPKLSDAADHTASEAPPAAVKKNLIAGFRGEPPLYGR